MVAMRDLNSLGYCDRAGSSPAPGTKLRNSKINSYIELLVRSNINHIISILTLSVYCNSFLRINLRINCRC